MATPDYFADGVAISYVPAAANKLNLNEFIVLVQKCMEMSHSTTGGHHLGPERVAVVRNRGVAAKQGFLMYYTKGIAIGTEVSVRYKESGRLSGLVVKRGSTVHVFILVSHYHLVRSLPLALV